MVIPDANILIYAHFADTPQYRVASGWLEQQLGRPETVVGLCWVTLWAFIRIGTNPRLWPKPPSIEVLFDRIDEWRNQPNVVLLNPGTRHQAILKAMMLESGVVGGSATDAVLAAMAIENAATLASTDRDFRRFSGLRWVNPLD